MKKTILELLRRTGGNLKFSPLESNLLNKVDLFEDLETRSFYKNYNPEKFEISWLLGELILVPVNDLSTAQIGYGTDAITGKLLTQWPSVLKVIGNSSGDPISIDSITGKVFYAIHGTGVWEPVEIANQIGGFLQLILAWIEATQDYQGLIQDEDFEYTVEFINFFELCASQKKCSKEHITSLISLM